MKMIATNPDFIRKIIFIKNEILVRFGWNLFKEFFIRIVFSLGVYVGVFKDACILKAGGLVKIMNPHPSTCVMDGGHYWNKAGGRKYTSILLQ